MQYTDLHAQTELYGLCTCAYTCSVYTRLSHYVDKEGGEKGELRKGGGRSREGRRGEGEEAIDEDKGFKHPFSPWLGQTAFSLLGYPFFRAMVHYCMESERVSKQGLWLDVECTLYSIAAIMYTYILEPTVNYMCTIKVECEGKYCKIRLTHLHIHRDSQNLGHYTSNSPLILARQCQKHNMHIEKTSSSWQQRLST